MTKWVWVFAAVLAVHLLAVAYLLVPRSEPTDSAAGNEAPATTEEPAGEHETETVEEEEEQQEPEYGTYVVQSGDSLSVIARRHGTTLSEIRRLNDITGDVIHPGQELIVPPPPEDGE